MWSSEVLDQCAIIRIKGRFPRELPLMNRKMMLENSFFFLSKENEEYFVYRNLERKLTDIDKLNLEKDPEFKRRGMKIIDDTFLQIRVEDDLLPVLNKLNELKWSRVNPCILSHSQDAYIHVEFINDDREAFSRLILEFIESHVQDVELVYLGGQNESIPYILKLFLDFGGNLNDLFVIKTEWHMNSQNVQIENSGVFQNEGKFIPNYFTNGPHDTLIFKLARTEIKGKYKLMNFNDSNMVMEIDTETNFFHDFNTEVVSNYYGALFYEAEVRNDIVTNFYIVDRNLSSVFLAGLKRHWSLPKRSNHKNLVVSAIGLGEFYKQSVPDNHEAI